MKYQNFAHHIDNNKQPEFMAALIDLSPSMDETDWKPDRKAGAVKAMTELLKVKKQLHPQDRGQCFCEFRRISVYNRLSYSNSSRDKP